MRKQRNVDVEPVFGYIKQDRHFRRFMPKGLDGVTTETGLLAIAHILKKWWRKTITRTLTKPRNAKSAQMPLFSPHIQQFNPKYAIARA